MNIEVEQIWGCPDCGMHEVHVTEDRGLYLKKYRQERFGEPDVFGKHRSCQHPRKVYTHGYCKKCGRKLSKLGSIAMGIGSCCLRKENGKIEVAS